jgi:hypothetical protein
MGDDKAIIASNEDYNNRKLSPTDKALLEAAKNPTAPGNTPITSVEQFMEMAKQAQARMTEFRINIRNKMTKKRAEKVYEYYVNQKYSWRLLAMGNMGRMDGRCSLESSRQSTCRDGAL